MHQHGGDIYNNFDRVDFSTNINLLGTPKSVVLAACEGASLSYRYPDTQCVNLREAISKAEVIPMEQIICGNGAADLIFSLVLATKPKRALLPVPSFYEYNQALRMLDCEVEYHYLKEENGFELQEDFLDKMTKNVDIIFLCNPNNPTGILTKLDFMKKVIHQCEVNDILLVVDECFMDFVEGRKAYTIKDLCKNTKNLFVLKAFTKLYAMPGLRLGYGFSSNMDLIEKMKNVSQPWSVSIPAQMAGIAALKEVEYVKQSQELLLIERMYLIDELKKLHFKVFDSKANYIFFSASKGLYDICLRKGFLIRDCSNYEGLKEGFYRIAIKTQDENRKLINALKEEI